jgi:predicted nucleotidyltransferase
MKSSAVICEFNPIHNGHKYILDRARDYVGHDGCVIAVMSGNFTQRCTPAVYDKYTRAHTALLCGADIVFELPFPWCSSGAEDFALGGVSIAASLGAGSLTFGSESGDIELIEKCSEIKASDSFTETIRRLEKENRSIGSAVLYQRSMADMGVDIELGANDKLGVEYMCHGKLYGISEYNAVKRDTHHISAGEIRGKVILSGLESVRDDIPAEAYDLLKNEHYLTEERYNDILFSYSRLLKSAATSELVYAQKTSFESVNSDEFIKKLPQKKLTLARMRRELLFSLLGVKQMNKKSPPCFTVLLAANERGREYYKCVKKSLEIQVITKPADFGNNDQYAVAKEADRLYTLCTGERADMFIRMSPVIL